MPPAVELHQGDGIDILLSTQVRVRKPVFAFEGISRIFPDFRHHLPVKNDIEMDFPAVFLFLDSIREGQSLRYAEEVLGQCVGDFRLPDVNPEYGRHRGYLELLEIAGAEFKPLYRSC